MIKGEFYSIYKANVYLLQTKFVYFMCLLTTLEDEVCNFCPFPLCLSPVSFGFPSSLITSSVFLFFLHSNFRNHFDANKTPEPKKIELEK